MAKTHEMIFSDQKPPDEQIIKMVIDYFNSEATAYDQYNQKTEKRRLFLGKIDELVASDIQKSPLTKNVLSIGCGTCFREEKIRLASNVNFSLTGVDISSSMCQIAIKNGHRILNSNWLDADLNNEIFDAVMYLYSLGLSPSAKSRQEQLTKIASHLRPGGKLYFDVMNLLDKSEWGPDLINEFHQKNLEKKGYELGDVFYRRIGSDQVSFFHYFTFEEVKDLLTSTGFRLMNHYYIDCNKNFGEIVGPNEGAILFIAEKL